MYRLNSYFPVEVFTSAYSGKKHAGNTGIRIIIRNGVKKR
jgi:hypothetical protein